MQSAVPTAPRASSPQPAHKQNDSRKSGAYSVQSGSDVDDSSADEAGAEGNNKKRKRSMKISCELCKQRKVKCDKAEPACGWCARNSRTCVYKERKRPGVRTTSEIDLEDKVNRMEAMLHLLGAKVEDHIAQDHGVKAAQEFAATAAQLRSPTHFQNLARTSSIDDYSRATPASMSDWKSITTRSDRNFPRPAESMSIRSLVGEGDLNNSMRQERSEIDSSTVNGEVRDLIESELPPYDLLYSLVDLYFKHVATWSPILDRKITFDTIFGKAVPEEPDRILLHAIVAVTLRFSKDSRLTPQSRRRYHDISRQKVQLYGLENPNIQALQALVILAIDILGTSNGPQGWNLLALIARNVVQLGLNVEKSTYLAAPPYPSISCLQAFAISQPSSWTENEARRRLLWMVYVLDRYTTISTSFNFTLDDNEIDRPLPCSYDLFSQNQPVETKWFRYAEKTETIMNYPDNVGSFAYHCEVLRILSRIHKFLKVPLDISSFPEVQNWRQTYINLDTDLNSFLAQLPGDYGRISQLCHSDPGSKISNWIMLHAAFVTSVIRLHSAAAYPTVCSRIFTPSHQAMQKCLAAVESLKAIAQDVVDSNGLDLLGPPFAFSLWVSARVLLVHAATLETSVDPKISFFIRTLQTMGHYWEVAQRYAKILDRLVQEGKYGQDGYTNSNASQSRTFTVMRRSAFELNKLVSSKPKSVLQPTSTRFTTLSELEYLDVFDFFNYPRLPENPQPALNDRDSETPGAQRISHFNDLRASQFAPLNAESDWLSYRSPTG